MRMTERAKQYLIAAVLVIALQTQTANAQTDADAIMMAKNNFCVGAMYGYNSWKNYWEGTLKRDNQNLGTVSAQTIGIMGNYGISNSLNVLFSVPYIQTKASAGTLHGMSGVQDMSLWVKWMPVVKDIGKGSIALYGLGGLSFPLTDYTADFLPMSIGLQSTNLSARIMADYSVNKFFVTASGTYTYRTNIDIDRTSYYTTEMHLTNEVKMPDVASVNLRAGYRSSHLIAEVVANNMTTLGGFDIRRNDMPFPSNEMNATTVGAAFKYTFKKPHQLSLVGNASYVVAGRNVGQATSFSAGAFYAFGLTKKAQKTPSTTIKN